jgi:hypothetical protein
MDAENIAVYLNMSAIAKYELPGRVVEDLGQVSEVEDRFRITFWQRYPSQTGFAVNRKCDMKVVCLIGIVHFFYKDESECIKLVPGAEMEVRKGTKYCWSPLTEKVILLVNSTPHWFPEQHEEIHE